MAKKSRKASKKIVDTKMAAANDTTLVGFATAAPALANVTPRLTAEQIATQKPEPVRSERGTAVASGFAYNKLAGGPSKQAVIAVFGQSGYSAYSWVSRASKLGITPEELCEKFVADPKAVKVLWEAATAKKETK